MTLRESMVHLSAPLISDPSEDLRGTPCSTFPIRAARSARATRSRPRPHRTRDSPPDPPSPNHSFPPLTSAHHTHNLSRLRNAPSSLSFAIMPNIRTPGTYHFPSPLSIRLSTSPHLAARGRTLRPPIRIRRPSLPWPMNPPGGFPHPAAIQAEIPRVTPAQ